MSGVSITDPGPALNPSVLMELLGSTEAVAARVKAYEKAKTEAEAALKELNLGQTAKAAMEEAEYLRGEAQKELTTAKENAAKTMADAKTWADDAIKTAREEQAKIAADIAAEHKEHQEWLRKTKAEAAKATKAAKDAMAEAEAMNRESKQLLAQATKMQESAEKVQALAEEARRDFEAKSAKVVAALESMK